MISVAPAPQGGQEDNVEKVRLCIIYSYFISPHVWYFTDIIKERVEMGISTDYLE